MALSYVNYPGDGVTKRFTVTFPYIDQSHVSVLVGGAPVTYTWFSSTQVECATAPADGAGVQVRRDTPIDRPLVDFAGGAVLTDANLDTSTLQAIYTDQEQQDRLDEFNTTVNSIVLSSGGVPTPSNPADDGKVLQAQSGAWSWQSFVTTLASISGLLAWAKTFLEQSSASTALTYLGGVPTSRTVSAGTGLSGGGALSANQTLSLSNSGVTPGAFTNPSISVDTYGRVTAAANGLAPGPHLVARHTTASGVAGGATTAATWHTRPLAAVSNSIAGASLASNQITLPAGTYHVRAWHTVNRVDGNQLGLYSVSNSSYFATGSGSFANQANSCGGFAELSHVMTLTGATVFELRSYAAAAQATNGLGNPVSTGQNEVYAAIEITKVA